MPKCPECGETAKYRFKGPKDEQPLKCPNGHEFRRCSKHMDVFVMLTEEEKASHTFDMKYQCICARAGIARPPSPPRHALDGCVMAVIGPRELNDREFVMNTLEKLPFRPRLLLYRYEDMGPDAIAVAWAKSQAGIATERMVDDEYPAECEGDPAPMYARDCAMVDRADTVVAFSTHQPNEDAASQFPFSYASRKYKLFEDRSVLWTPPSPKRSRDEHSDDDEALGKRVKKARPTVVYAAVTTKIRNAIAPSQCASTIIDAPAFDSRQEAEAYMHKIVVDFIKAALWQLKRTDLAYAHYWLPIARGDTGIKEEFMEIFDTDAIERDFEVLRDGLANASSPLGTEYFHAWQVVEMPLQ